MAHLASLGPPQLPERVVRPFHGADAPEILRRASEETERMEQSGYGIALAVWSGAGPDGRMTLTVTYRLDRGFGQTVPGRYAEHGPPRGGRAVHHSQEDGMGQRLAQLAQAIGLIATMIVLALVLALMVTMTLGERLGAGG